MSPASWQDWIAWAGVILPLAGLAWAALVHVYNVGERQRQQNYSKFMDLIERYNNPSGKEPLFTQLAAAFELRNYPQYKDVIFRIRDFQSDVVNSLENVSDDPSKLAKRKLIQSELTRTTEYLSRRGRIAGLLRSK